MPESSTGAESIGVREWPRRNTTKWISNLNLIKKNSVRWLTSISIFTIKKTFQNSWVREEIGKEGWRKGWVMIFIDDLKIEKIWNFNRKTARNSAHINPCCHTGQPRFPGGRNTSPEAGEHRVGVPGVLPREPENLGLDVPPDEKREAFRCRVGLVSYPSFLENQTVFSRQRRQAKMCSNVQF